MKVQAKGNTKHITSITILKRTEPCKTYSHKAASRLGGGFLLADGGFTQIRGGFLLADQCQGEHTSTRTVIIQ